MCPTSRLKSIKTIQAKNIVNDSEEDLESLQECGESTKTLREKCLYSEFSWSVFPRIRTEYSPYLSVFSSNAGKYGP